MNEYEPDTEEQILFYNEKRSRVLSYLATEATPKELFIFDTMIGMRKVPSHQRVVAYPGGGISYLHFCKHKRAFIAKLEEL